MPVFEFPEMPNRCAYALVPHACHIGAVLDYTLGLTCEQRRRSALENKRPFSAILIPEKQQCLTQNRLSWSSTTIRTYGPRLGVSCDQSDWKLSFSRPSPIFSSRIRRMAPRAWSST